MKKLLLIALIAVLFYGCKKDEEPKSNKDYLTAKQWHYISIKEGGIAVIMEDCWKDNLMKFETNDTVTFNPGIIKCDQLETIVTRSWSLSSDGKSITFIDTGGTDKYTIVELTANKLVLFNGVGMDSFELTLIVL